MVLKKNLRRVFIFALEVFIRTLTRFKVMPVNFINENFLILYFKNKTVLKSCLKMSDYVKD